MRGSLMIVSICSCEANTLTYAPSGTPASFMICSTASADFGTDSACLRMMVLPSIRLGAANRAIW